MIGWDWIGEVKEETWEFMIERGSKHSRSERLKRVLGRRRGRGLGKSRTLKGKLRLEYNKGVEVVSGLERSEIVDQ